MDVNMVSIIMFICFGLGSYPSDYIIDKYGLRFAVLLGSVLSTVGCALRLLVFYNF